MKLALYLGDVGENGPTGMTDTAVNDTILA